MTKSSFVFALNSHQRLLPLLENIFPSKTVAFYTINLCLWNNPMNMDNMGLLERIIA
jgi:hypothetical protein